MRFTTVLPLAALLTTIVASPLVPRGCSDSNSVHECQQYNFGCDSSCPGRYAPNPPSTDSAGAMASLVVRDTWQTPSCAGFALTHPQTATGTATTGASPSSSTAATRRRAASVSASPDPVKPNRAGATQLTYVQSPTASAGGRITRESSRSLWRSWRKPRAQSSSSWVTSSAPWSAFFRNHGPSPTMSGEGRRSNQAVTAVVKVKDGKREKIPLLRKYKAVYRTKETILYYTVYSIL
jgi:hypothetical protein